MCLLVGAQALNGALVVSTIKTARDLSGFQYLWNVYSFVNLIANTSGFIEALITGAILLSNVYFCGIYSKKCLIIFLRIV